jgi:ankyrin repeat protein
MAIEFKFSSAEDPTLALSRRQFTLRQLFAWMAMGAVILFGYRWVQHAQRPTELLTAAKNGDLVQIQRLVGSGVDIHYRDGWNTTALMLASSYGHLACVWNLLECGADPNERSRFDATPLIWAAKMGHKDVEELLIEHGAVTSLTDANALTAADHARLNGFMELSDSIASREDRETKR